MKQDLEQIKREIETHLKDHDFVVFRGLSRIPETNPFIYWDTERYPDFRSFLDAAARAGIRLIVIHDREFSAGYIDDALDRLESTDLSGSERKSLERRMKALRAYEGFTCAVELSFDWEGRVYFFGVRTEWYEDLLDILDEIDAASPDDEEEEGEEPLGGYYSRN